MTCTRLSKSRLNSFRQCPKRLWLEVHEPELRQETPDMQARFAVGHQVGEIAQRDYPGGLLIAPNNDLRQALAETQAALPQHRPLFEATFEYEAVLVRADLLMDTDADAQVGPPHIGQISGNTS